MNCGKNEEEKFLKIINNIRSNLGCVYGTRSIAELGFNNTWECYRDATKNYIFAENDSLPESELDRKMQVIAVEPLHWDENIFLSHLCVIFSEYDVGSKQWRFPPPGHKFRECIVLKEPVLRTQEDKSLKDHLKERFEQYIKELQNHIKKKQGSSVQDLVYLTHRFMVDSSGKHSQTLPPPIIGPVYISKPGYIHYEIGTTRNATYDDKVAYDREVIEATFNISGSKTVHLAMGNDTNFMHQKNNIVSAAHIFIVFSKEKKMSSDFCNAINGLLQHLVTVATSEALKAQQESYEKQSQMLKLLQEPLKVLTSGLEATVESAQRLRAILYDPSRSIFAAARECHRYFEEGEEVKIAGSIWQASHKQSDRANDQHLSLTVLAIIAHIFGIFNEKHGSNRVAELWERVDKRLFGSDPAEDYIRKFCRAILFVRISRETDEEKERHAYHDRGELWYELRECSTGTCGFERDSKMHWRMVVDYRFKSLLHEPYKFNSTSDSILPLAIILYEKNSQCKLEAIEYEQDKSTGTKTEKRKDKYTNFEDVLASGLAAYYAGEEIRLFSGCKLPYPRAIVLWTLILQLLSLKSYKPKEVLINTITGSETEIKILFEGANFTEDKFASLMNQITPMILRRRTGIEYISGGDETLPWFNFALSCEGEACYDSNEKELNVQYSGNKFSISYNEGGQAITFKVEPGGTEE